MSVLQAKVYKIFTEDEWQAFQASGEFSGSVDDWRDGFIHLSTRDQVGAVIEKFFAGKGPLHVAEFSSLELPGELKWEEAASGERFPHLYGSALFKSKATSHSKIQRNAQIC